MTELRTLIESAYNTAKQGYYKDALEEFRFILKSESESRDALYGAAACAFRLAQNDLAEDYAARLLKKSPQDAQTLALRERILASGFASEEEKSKTLVQRMLEEDEDPFGVGTDKKVSEVIPEWTPLDVRVPNFWDLLDYGKTLQPGRLKILSVYGEAARLYRSGFKRLVWAGWVSLLVQLGILFVLVSIFSGLLVWVAGGGPLKLAVFQLLLFFVGFFLYPLLSVHTQFCYRWRKNSELSAGDQLRFVEKYPYILACFLWSFFPTIFLWLLMQVRAVVFPPSWAAFLPPRNANDAIVLAFLLSQLLVYLRTWFLHLVIFDEEMRPLAAVSKAYYLTRKQNLRTLLFIALQTLLFPLAVLPLGIGYPFLCLAQAVAFDRLDPSKDEGG